MRTASYYTVILLLLAFLFSSCINDGGSNKPPVIKSLSANPNPPTVNNRCTLSCDASDENNDKLSYTWSGVSVNGSGPTVTWTPSATGQYKIDCTISDGNGGKVTQTIYVSVINDGTNSFDKGSLQIISSPQGARVYLNEEDSGKTTPCTIENLDKGSYTVKLTLANYADWGPQSVSIKAGEVSTLDATLGKELGLKFLPKDDYKNLPIGRPRGDTGSVPSKVDLTSSFPSPGDQGDQGSCVGWSLSYIKTYQEYSERKWALNDNAHQFSPAFIFNQSKVTTCANGCYMIDALELLETKGCATQKDMPYSEFSCSDMPSSTILENAKQYRIATWSRINQGSISEMKSFLANDKVPIFIGIDVKPDFDRISSGNPIFDNDSGQSRGGHALAIIGYDDSKEAFKFINSWGTNWGIGGYGWISYNIVVSVVEEAYVAYDYIDKENPPELKNSILDPSSGNSLTNFAFKVDYYDKDNDSPTEMKVFIDGIGYNMTLLSGSAWNGTYQFTTKLSSVTHQYYFFTNDGTFTVRFPSLDYYNGPQVTTETPAPSISSVSPQPMYASSNNQTLTIFGSYFQSGATLTFDPPTGQNIPSTASKLTVVSSSQIDYQINNYNDSGTWTVTVTNPDGKSSSPKNFTVKPSETPAPSISSVSPQPMYASSNNQTLTIFGSYFQSGATLTFDPPTGQNIPSTASKLTVVSSSQIDYQINNYNDSGTWTVTVTNPDGKSSSPKNFTVKPSETPAPSISSVSPQPMYASSNNQTLTIFGSYFQSGATLTFDPPTGQNIPSTASKLTVVSSSQIDYQINNYNDSGTWTVTVTNPDGKSSSPKNFTVTVK